MSYYATIDGMITFPKETERSQLLNRLDGFLNECDPEIMSEEENTFTLYFGGYQAYRDDEIYRFLADIEPFTVSGVITYCGEDNSLWRHFFDPQKKVWIEQDGYVSYEEEGKSIVSIIEHQIELKERLESQLKGDDAR